MENLIPVSSFYFQVMVGSDEDRVDFTEVSGLTMETEVIEYRSGNDPTFQKSKYPGMNKFSNITLKRGVMAKKSTFFKWLKSNLPMKEGNQKNIKIMLLDVSDSNGEPVITWEVNNAWPVKWEGPTLKADGNEIAIETIELAHDGFIII